MSHSIDFFAVVGRKDENKLTCTSLPSLWEENRQSTLADVWNDAITDIALVTEYNRESIDDTWTIIDSSTDGIEFIDYDIKICLAYKRRRESKKIDHISQVKCIDLFSQYFHLIYILLYIYYYILILFS